MLLKEVTGRPEPFGNICVVLSGDLLQFSLSYQAKDEKIYTRIEMPLELTVESREELIHHVFRDLSSPLRVDCRYSLSQK
ncbi:ATP-dependent DNA helicase [Frankliniella fusca]|uniref:ATP-dependent DNA helicase n=1 Tax=Frankliniella fusca TaxID=407009 RepID=A0AAE1L8T4_9NEOP|nr:ATP-dependent DNA helicase [Frankliniella fusca]